MGSIEQIDLFPEGGCDTHHHIFESHKFPSSPTRHLTPPKATIEEYEAFKRSLGITNSVLTHGPLYGHDCSSLTVFVKQLGSASTRGCAVINEEASDAEIESLHNSGVRGIRLDLYGYNAMEDAKKQIRVLELYASRVGPKGQLGSSWEDIPSLALQVVVDHHALLKAQSMLPVGVDVLSQPGLLDIVALLKSENF
ncbi:uncharacterized protein PAC_01883 [Phialocephala subalpina]|uniref:Amidohydrolase-related domain-containing protein n=1 Tax=Phialocephala subalpina TaxID=576137 RepID=A0A1L7WGU8_9HELO|nr:uncharacterized protein PAC_01883 [Phialocephala subalpina]